MPEARQTQRLGTVALRLRQPVSKGCASGQSSHQGISPRRYSDCLNKSRKSSTVSLSRSTSGVSLERTHTRTRSNRVFFCLAVQSCAGNLYRKLKRTACARVHRRSECPEEQSNAWTRQQGKNKCPSSDTSAHGAKSKDCLPLFHLTVRPPTATQREPEMASGSICHKGESEIAYNSCSR